MFDMKQFSHHFSSLGVSQFRNLLLNVRKEGSGALFLLEHIIPPFHSTNSFLHISGPKIKVPPVQA